MRTLRYVRCDVFTNRPFTGNQLAVFTDARGVEPATMQALAREMNLSEITFVLPPSTKEAHARVRIFTPAAELPFAGHPLLGTAAVLGQPMQLEAIRLETASAITLVRFEREGPRIVFGWMQQPIPTHQPFAEAEALLAALGVPRSGLPVEVYDNGPRHVFVDVGSPEAVAAVRPDLGRLGALPVDGIAVFAAAEKKAKLRLFGPRLGISEDPATGSAAGHLALHLSRHGRLPFGGELEIEQGEEILRPSRLYVRIAGADGTPSSIEVGGGVIHLGRGELQIP